MALAPHHASQTTPIGSSFLRRVVLGSAAAATLCLCSWQAVASIYPDTLASLLPTCLFRSATSLPCPFCGGSRAAQSIVLGDFLASLRYNPLFIMFATLTIATAFAVLWKCFTTADVLLSRRWTIVWIVTITASWIAKLCTPSQYW
ncbi:MAG: DUF2752 domain-containing protein [Phycisphaerales bacterium]|nr:DUF2752 domain-containing protein [Phycisphaerales bacterium]